MNLLDIRQNVWDGLDWEAKPSVKAVQRMDRFINRAYDQVALDVPFLFFEDEFVLRLLPDVAPTLDTDTVTPVTNDTGTAFARNPWVFSIDLPAGTSGAVNWRFDRTWDSRWIEILDENGGYRTLRIRSIWREGDNAFFSVVQPWDIEEWGNGPFATWRVYSSEYYLPDDLVDIKNISVYHEQNHLPVTVLPQAEAENLGLAEHDADAPTGLPRLAYRRRHEQIRGPVTAPTVALGVLAPENWLGPEPHGQFQYMVTYCWGKRSMNHRNPGLAWFSGSAETHFEGADMGTDFEAMADNRTVEPIFESAPSPASETITVSGNDNAYAKRVEITVPNIEYMLGFMVSGSMTADTMDRISAGRSGWYVRIYRRRLTMDVGDSYQDLGAALTGKKIDTLTLMDFDDGFYLLAEMKIDSTNGGVFHDTGEILPDHSRRVRDIHGYQSLRFYPHPDVSYDIRLRGTRRPEKLISPYDVPRVHAEACELITAKALEFHYENLHDQASANLSRQRYGALLEQLRRRYGTAVPASQPIPRRPVRYPRAGRTRRR